jgi:hypothetical protein
MTRSVELAALDLRYESYRMRNPVVEARLLAAIADPHRIGATSARSGLGSGTRHLSP